MKNKFYSIFFLIIVIAIPASGQGINRLWGLLPIGGSGATDIGLGMGTMFSTDGAGQNLVTHLNFPQITPGGGRNPEKNTVIAHNGKLYGMTLQGGTNDMGVLFSWDPVGMRHTNHHHFQEETGSRPAGGLVEYNGKLYGMTSAGGENGIGVIFSWDPVDGEYEKLFDFLAGSGGAPIGSLTPANGKLYGMTPGGGANSMGVIFEWDPNEEDGYAVLHDFSGTDGAIPMGDLLSLGGKLYGMTFQGGQHGSGVIFEWDNGTYNLLHQFHPDQGGYPFGNGLTAYDNKLFGITAGGGNAGGGVIFELDNGNYVVRHHFSQEDGVQPNGALVVKDNKFYGLTFMGGGLDDSGVIFEWDPESSVYTVLHAFDGFTGGRSRGSLLLADGKFYGLSRLGGVGDSGVLFEWDPDEGAYTERSVFLEDLVTSFLPLSNVSFLDGKLFATTSLDLLTMGGSIFEWDPENQRYTVRYSFDVDDEAGMPYGGMIEKDGKFYGLAGTGGANEAGIIFEWDPVTGTLHKRYDLPEGFESGPAGSFLLLNGKFYGVASSYGDGDGLFFEWNPDANGGAGEFIERYLFSGESAENGFMPAGITVKGDKIYGITSGGGVHGNGIVFEWDPALNAFSKKLDLDIVNGGEVFYTGAMALKDGIFYGTALMMDPVASEVKGILYGWDPETNLFTVQFDFTDADDVDVRPFGILGVNNGKLYGMASSGCDCESEAIFIYEWDPSKARYTKRADVGDNINGIPPVLFPFLKLVPVPVPVSEGQPGECLLLSVTIDASNSDEWVPVIDAEGKAVAEINANGNELGNVLVSVYIHDGAVREDGMKRLYLDRSVTITPEHSTLEPGTEVDIRLYIHEEEYDALADATNSDDQPSGIAGIGDLGLFKNESDDCNGMLLETAAPLEVLLAEDWLRGYVLQTSVNSFSTFFFASSEHSALPVRLVSFRAGIEETNGILTWQTEEETAFSHIEVERSLDGKTFAFIGSRAAQGRENNGRYTFVDPGITEKATGNVYYRLKLVDIDGSFVFSEIVATALSHSADPLYVYPNPAVETLSVRMKAVDNIHWQIVDLSGRCIKSGAESGTALQVWVRDLLPGIYHLILNGQHSREKLRFVKH